MAIQAAVVKMNMVKTKKILMWISLEAVSSCSIGISTKLTKKNTSVADTMLMHELHPMATAIIQISQSKMKDWY